MDTLVQLCGFLHEKNSSVRQIALANLLGHTPKGSPHRDVFLRDLQGDGLAKSKDSVITRDLKLLCRDQLAIGHDAFRALVNLSDSSLIAGALTEPDFLTFLVSYIVHPPSVLADLAAMLLSNLTANPTACAFLLSMRIPIIQDTLLKPVPFYPPRSRCATSISPVPYPPGEPIDLPALPFLIQAFVEGATLEMDASKRLRKGQLHFLGSVLANVSATIPGRLFFLTPRPSNPLLSENDEGAVLEYPLTQVLSFTEHRDLIRRGGAASTIKNCAFYVPAHSVLLADEHEELAVTSSGLAAPGINALSAILLPLAGPEEFEIDDMEKLPPSLQFLPDSKRREVDTALRLTHVEALLLLCTSRHGREKLRNSGVYEVVRAAHLVETEDRISEHIERLVVLLKGDEHAEIAEVDETGNIADTTVSADLGSVGRQVEVTDLTKEDDEDERIEEV